MSPKDATQQLTAKPSPFSSLLTTCRRRSGFCSQYRAPQSSCRLIATQSPSGSPPAAALAGLAKKGTQHGCTYDSLQDRAHSSDSPATQEQQHAAAPPQYDIVNPSRTNWPTDQEQVHATYNINSQANTAPVATSHEHVESVCVSPAHASTELPRATPQQREAFNIKGRASANNDHSSGNYDSSLKCNITPSTSGHAQLTSTDVSQRAATTHKTFEPGEPNSTNSYSSSCSSFECERLATPPTIYHAQLMLTDATGDAFVTRQVFEPAKRVSTEDHANNSNDNNGSNSSLKLAPATVATPNHISNAHNSPVIPAADDAERTPGAMTLERLDELLGFGARGQIDQSSPSSSSPERVAQLPHLSTFDFIAHCIASLQEELARSRQR
jgi:hypothetical protein